MAGGGGGGSSRAARQAPPSNPTRWLYDRTGTPVTLQQYGTYVDVGGAYQLRYDNPAMPQGLYLSPEAAAQKNPKVWLYDKYGEAKKQVFRGGEGADEVYDEAEFNLGPEHTPYRHWYDIYGVSQKYAPTSTELEKGFWDDPTRAPRSPSFKAPVSYDDVDPKFQVQGGDDASGDIAAAKEKAKERKKVPHQTPVSDEEDATYKPLLGD